MSSTLIALSGFITWSLALLVLMELMRTKLVITKEVEANEFNPQNSNLSPFMQRLARAHANCVESLPIFGGLLFVAIISGNEQITDPLALVFLAARIIQSLIHLFSLSVIAVTLRFTAFAIQIFIGCYWAYGLLTV